jgi:hypothetical protein
MLCRVRCNLLHFQCNVWGKSVSLNAYIRVSQLVDPSVLFYLVKGMEIKSLM